MEKHEKYLGILLIYAILTTGISIGLLLKPESPNVYVVDENQITGFMTNNSESVPKCSGCYITLNNNYVFVGTVYTIELNNLTIDQGYVLILEDNVILFTAIETQQYFYSNAVIPGEARITLLEYYSLPYVFDLKEISQLADLQLLDQQTINFIEVSN
jgi:hypothetical protein